MNGYELSRRWFDFAFENKECKARHIALYLWIVELNNRLGWKKQFGIPTHDTMEGLSIGNKGTYLKTLKDLEIWGFIEIVQASKNQYQSCIIELCRIKSEPALATALDTALIQHSFLPVQNRNGIDTGTITSIDTSIGSSTVPIVKQLNLETIKPINQETIANRDEIKEGFVPPQKEEVNPPPKVARKGSSKFDPLIVDLPFEGDDFKKVWSDWIIHRKQKRSSLTEKSVIEQLKLLSCYTETVAIKMILKSITSGWLGIFPIKETGNGNQLNQSNPVDGVSERLKGAWELLAEHHKNN